MVHTQQMKNNVLLYLLNTPAQKEKYNNNDNTFLHATSVEFLCLLLINM